jgi:hypothetical protein
MSYIINKTDGSRLTEIVDGTVDHATDLTLLGKNSSSYGEFFNENLVYLLENFANTSAPNNPITGQLWYDTSEGRLKIYDGTLFKVSGGTIVSNIVPSSISSGDLWVDSYRQQLYFNDGVSTILAGPGYSYQQGISGCQTIDVLDISNNIHTIVLVYVGRVLIGLFSKDSFVPKSPIAGFTGNVEVGFNTGNYSGIKFHTRATSADALVNPADGSLLTASSFVNKNDDNIFYGIMTILNNKPLVLGQNSSNEIQVRPDLFSINSNATNQDFKINILNGGGIKPAITINAASEKIGIFNNNPSSTLDITGDVKSSGNITTTSALKIGPESNITLNWDNSSTSLLSDKSINVTTGNGYKINGTSVLNSTTLGTTVVSSSLTSVGSLVSLQVDSININDSTISYVNESQTNGDIVLTPKGSGTVNVSSSKIINVASATAGTDAVNLNKLNSTVKSRPLGLSLNTANLSNISIATNYLSIVFPSSDYSTNTLCRVVCNEPDNISIRLFKLSSSGVWEFQNNL